MLSEVSNVARVAHGRSDDQSAGNAGWFSAALVKHPKRSSRLTSTSPQHLLPPRRIPLHLPNSPLDLHRLAMFSRLLPRTVARGAFQAQNQTPQILRASPVTSHLQGRISQRRGYATPSGMYCGTGRHCGALLILGQRRRTSSSSAVVLPAMSPLSRLARKA